MNEIETKFFEAYLEYEGITKESDCCILKPHTQIGIYQADFVFDNKIVIEIDGHEFHKTKEQRFNDYNRERYMMKKGYIVIRFMGTEVFLDSEKCVQEMFDIDTVFHEKICAAFGSGLEAGREGK